MIKVKTKLNVQINARGRKTIRRFTGDEDNVESPAKPAGRIPRIARLMALAIRYQSMLQNDEVADMIELARIAHVSQPRMTQIMGLNLLAPDIQEALLNLPPQPGKCQIHEKRLRPLTAMLRWEQQRSAWSEMLVEIGEAEAVDE
ncbi:hypothetical protein [Allorhodopirellula solitaria]|uniref:Uncharacterized protein n=1 Tax=Allorhodopirellula solitaria TaxID=2527987 RepID=A0A5C5YIV9_9BACT|nr:hypothetical protein [Allorhodopirellula solitaria]TWT74806.1 hypothetical protein CA85_00920 [Allorhodopirellula solitaria]